MRGIGWYLVGFAAATALSNPVTTSLVIFKLPSGKYFHFHHWVWTGVISCFVKNEKIRKALRGAAIQGLTYPDRFEFISDSKD